MAVPPRETGFVTRATGATAGAVLSVVALSPLEVAKVRAHTLDGRGLAWPRIARRVVAREGVGALYRGIGPTLLMTVPRTVIYLSAFDTLTAAAPISGGATLAAGCAARALATTAVAPLELVSTRLRAAVATEERGLSAASAAGGARARPPLSHALHQLKAECAARGARAALFRGLTPTLLTDVPFSGLMFLLYTRARDALRELRRDAACPAPPARELTEAAAASVPAGALAALVTAPCDLLKTRRQVLGGGATLFGDACVLLRARGPSALFAGAGARVAKVTPANAIIVTCFEAAKLALAPAPPPTTMSATVAC